MIGAMLKQANSQDYHPEWIIAAYQYTDLGFFARQYDQDQWAHAFGISNIPPGTTEDARGRQPRSSTRCSGTGARAAAPRASSREHRRQAHDRDHVRGPEAHPADPPAGAVRGPGVPAAPRPTTRTRSGRAIGRTDGLPYDEYLHGNKDFTVVWWDPDTVGPPAHQPGPAGRAGHALVPGRREALLRRPLADEALEVLRQVELGLPGRAPATARWRRCRVNGCPSETGQGQPSSS